MTRVSLSVCLVFAAALLSGCGVPRIPGITPYKPEIQQGNYVSPEMIAQVKPGMTREQVRFLVGPPMIADTFHHAQWDYYFGLDNQFVTSSIVRRHYIVRFDGNVVASVDEVKTNA